MGTNTLRGHLAAIAIVTIAGCSEGGSLSTGPELRGSDGPLMELASPTCRLSPVDQLTAGAWTCREAPATVANVTFEDFAHNEPLTNSVISGARFISFQALKEATAGGTGLFGNAPSGSMVAYWICTTASPPSAKCSNDYARRIDFVRPVNEISFQYAAVLDPILEDEDRPTLVILEAYRSDGTLLLADTGQVNNPSVTPIKNWSPMSVKYGTDNHIYYVILRGSPNRVGIDDFVTAAVNHSPVARIGLPAAAPEGATLTFSGSVSYDPTRSTDDGSAQDLRDGLVSYQWSFGAGAPIVTTVPTITHLFAGSGPQSVTLTVTDPNGVSHTTSETLTVANQPPVLTLGANAPPAAAQPFTLQASFADPGVETYWTYEIDWGTGFGAPDTLNAPGPIAATRLLAPGTHTIRVRVTDADGASDVETFTVTIANAAPTAAFTLPAGPANEGATVVFNGALSTDPENAALTYEWDFGDGVVTSASALAAHTHAYADNGTYTVKLTVRDPGGLSSTATGSITVDNVAPSATFNAPSSVVEGESFTISLSGFADPSSTDAAAGFTYAFDCGGNTLTWVASPVVSCTIPTANQPTRTLRGVIRDKDGGERTYSASVAVKSANVPPTITMPAQYAGLEGTPLALAWSASDAPGDVLSYSWSFGDGGSGTNQPAPPATHVYADDGIYTVTLTVKDAAGATTTRSAQATIANVAPALSVGANASLSFGAPLVRTGAVSDPGADAVTVTVDYGDGSAIQTVAVTGGAFTLSRSYAAAGVYTVTVTANDGDPGGVTTRTFTVTVAPPTPVTIRIEPETIKRNQVGTGTVTVFVERAVFDLANIDPATVTLGNRTGAETRVSTRNNGSYEVTFTPAHAIFKFERAKLLANGDLPNVPGTATLYLHGQLRAGGPMAGMHFEGSDQVRVIP